MTETGHGGILRVDFSSDGKWVRAEARMKDDWRTLAIVLLSAESGEACNDQEARNSAFTHLNIFAIRHDVSPGMFCARCWSPTNPKGR